MAKNREEVKAKLGKLKKLAEQGVGGEAKNAEILYHKLMRKYKISMDELEEEEVMEHLLVIQEVYLRKLILQIVMSKFHAEIHIVNSDITKKERRLLDQAYGVKGWNVLIKCTKLDYIQIMFEYEIYKESFLKSVDDLLCAFCMENGLLVEDTCEANLSEERKKQYRKAWLLTLGLDKTTVNKAIE